MPSRADKRFVRLKLKHRFSKSKASLLADGISTANGFPPVLGKDPSIVDAKGELMESKSSDDGKPTVCVIKSSWCKVDDPGKSGFPNKISPRIQPVLQISTQTL